jgi:PHD/YefM family antitoxin component YafN of YafNO toxin-antitoxin module
MESATTCVEIENDAVDGLVMQVEAGATVTLTRGRRPVAVVIGVGELERWSNERELLRRLALGELESAAGEGDDLDAVLEDCRLLIGGN